MRESWTAGAGFLKPNCTQMHSYLYLSSAADVVESECV